MTWLVCSVSMPHLRRHVARTLLTIVGVTVGVAGLTATLASTEAVFATYRRSIDATAGRADLHLWNGDAGVPEELLAEVQAATGVDSASGMVEGSVLVEDGGALTVFGFDLLSDDALRERLPRETLDVFDGFEFVSRLDSIAVARPWAARRRLALDGPLDVRTPRGLRRLIVRGIVDADGPTALYGGAAGVMDLPAAQRLLDKVDRLDRIDVRIGRGTSVAAVQAALRSIAAGRARVDDGAAHGARAEDVLASLRVMLSVAALIGAVVAACLVYHTMSVSIRQRAGDIAFLHTIGVRRATIVGWLGLEAVVLGTVATALGLGTGLALAELALAPFGTVVSAWVSVVPARVALDGGTIAAGFGLGLVTTVAGTLLPAWAVVRAPSVTMLRVGAGDSRSRSALVGVVCAGLGLVATTLLLVTAPRTLPYHALTPFILAVNALPLVCSALLSSPVTLAVGRLATALGERGRGLAILLAGSTLRRNPAGPIAVLVAIVTGLGFTIADATFVRSFESSFLAWIDDHYRSDLLVVAGSSTAPLLTAPRMGDDVVDAIRTTPGVAQAQGIRVTGIALAGHAAAIQAFDRADVSFPVVDARWPDVAEELWAGRGVLLGTNLAWKTTLAAGDAVELDSPSGTIRLPVLGTYPDYGGGDLGAVTMSRTLYREAWRDATVGRIRVWLEPGAQPEAVRRSITSRFGLTHALQVLTAGEFRAAAKALYVDNALGMLHALVLIALGTSFVGVVNFLIAAMLDRRHELSRLSALGVCGPMIASALVVEGALIGLVGACIGTVAGTLTSRILVHHSIRMVSGWSLTYAFPAVTATVVAAATVVIAACAAVPVARARPRNSVGAGGLE